MQNTKASVLQGALHQCATHVQDSKQGCGRLAVASHGVSGTTVQGVEVLWDGVGEGVLF
jgi:predicted RNA methylase